MTNDTYISGLCRINKHAERLSILRGIDRRGGEALGGFIQGWDGRGGVVGGACLLLDYNKLPATVDNQKPFTATGKYFLTQTPEEEDGDGD